MVTRRNALGLVAVLAGAIPFWFWLITLAPAMVSLDATVAAGFALALVPVGGLAAVLLFTPLSGRVLALLLGGGLVVGLVLSAAGHFFLAAPAKALAALVLGRLLGREVPQASWLVLAAALAFAVDTWSVFAGPTRAVVERAPGILDYLVVHYPGLGLLGPATGLGMSDFVFLGLLTAGAAATRLRARITLGAGLVSFVLTLGLALALERPLPALPLLCASFLAVNADLLHGRIRSREAGGI